MTFRLSALAVALAAVTLGGGCATGRTVVANGSRTVIDTGRTVIATTDEHQARVSRQLADLVDTVDKAFGESRVEDREQIVRAKLGLKTSSKDGEGTHWSVPINLRLPLPALKRRSNVFLDLSTDTETSEISDLSATLDSKISTLSATILSKITSTVDLGATLGVHGGPDIGPELFVRYEKHWAPWLLFVEQRLYWRTDNGWGGVTGLNLDRRLSGEASFLRFSNKASYYADLHGVDILSGFMYRRLLLLRTVLSAEAGVEYNPYQGDADQDHDADPGPDDDQAYARVRVIGKLWRPWLEWELVPGVYYRWEKEDKLVTGIDVRLSIIYESYLRGTQPPVSQPPVSVPPVSQPAGSDAGK
jgi:hypothetical protein